MSLRIVWVLLMALVATNYAMEGQHNGNGSDRHRSSKAKECAEYCEEVKPTDQICWANEVILRKSDCAFFKAVGEGKYKFVVGAKGQIENGQENIENEESLCCKPKQVFAMQFFMNVSNKRLLLAKDVAHFKFINNKSIDDWAQEDRVLAGVLEKAEDAYIEDAFGQQFFQDQMDANKIIQKAYVAQWQQNSNSLPSDAPPDLTIVTRPKVQEATEEMLMALSAFRRFHALENCANLVEKLEKSEGQFLRSFEEPNGMDAIRQSTVHLCETVPVETLEGIERKNIELLVSEDCYKLCRELNPLMAAAGRCADNQLPMSKRDCMPLNIVGNKLYYAGKVVDNSQVMCCEKKWKDQQG